MARFTRPCRMTKAVTPAPPTTTFGPAVSFLPARVQARLSVGPVGDPLEREADRVAEQVVHGLQATPTTSAAPSEQARRQEEREPVESREGEGPRVRLKAAVPGAPAGPVAPAAEAAIGRARGAGRPLPEGARASMEGAFQLDFSKVRIHADGVADRLSRSFRARAFTTGRDIFFRGGEYRPAARAGQQLLAHELTHVAQQAAGAPGGGGIVQRAIESCYIPGNDGPYHGESDGGEAIGPGREFRSGRRGLVRGYNEATHRNSRLAVSVRSRLRSDKDDNVLITKDKVLDHLVEVDHIVPESKGGGNTVENAQLLSAADNTAKSDTYPWGGYEGTRILSKDGDILDMAVDSDTNRTQVQKADGTWISRTQAITEDLAPNVNPPDRGNLERISFTSDEDLASDDMGDDMDVTMGGL